MDNVIYQVTVKKKQTNKKKMTMRQMYYIQGLLDNYGNRYFTVINIFPLKKPTAQFCVNINGIAKVCLMNSPFLCWGTKDSCLPSF